MLNDLDVIIRKYPKEQNELHVYAIGDVHVGSREYDHTSMQKKINIIADDPYGCVVLCGDLGDFGLKNSKTNVYQATMNPQQQKEYIYSLFYPIRDKISAAVPGNHEERITKEVGSCPLYDLCVLWGISDVYRENLAITKYMFGSIKNNDKQAVFVGITTHGSTRNKHKKFLGGVEGADFSVSGHTHTPEYAPHGKIRIDRLSGTARQVPFKEIIVDANLGVGGYGLKKEYEVPPPAELQYLELKTKRDSTSARTVHRIMNYHALQL